MKTSTAFVSALTASFLAAANCGDPAAPRSSAAANESIVAAGAGNVSALSCRQVGRQTASQVIGRSGGTIVIGPNRLTIPRYALSGNVRITATILNEGVNRVRLQPHGLEFLVPATLEMDYKHCSVPSFFIPRIAYVTSSLSILDLLPTIPNFSAKKATAYLFHFSDYALFSDHVVAWGPSAVSR
jgi:hypothetical protein